MKSNLLVPLILVAVSAEIAAGDLPKPPPFYFEVASSQTLPAPLSEAADLRWSKNGRIALSLGSGSTYEFSLEEITTAKTDVGNRLLEGGRGSRGPWLSLRLGLSNEYIAVGAGLFELAWTERTPGAAIHKIAFEGVEDLDVAGDQVVALGVRRDDDGEVAPLGAIGWLGSLSKGLADLRPVLFSTAGPGARPLDHCGTFSLGATRFLEDGRFVIIPGVEPGAFLFDSSGKLEHVWDTESIGLEIECDFDKDKLRLLSADFEARWTWLNQHVLVDDVISLPEGPAVVVRERADGRTHWRLYLLTKEAGPVAIDLPFDSESDIARLRGDVAGRRIVFLLASEKSPSGRESKYPPRLIVGTLKPGV